MKPGSPDCQALLPQLSPPRPHLPLATALTLAWRNLWRNHRRTLIMLLAIALGAWAMIFMSAMMRGMVYGLLQDGIHSLPGHVQIHHRDFLTDPSVVNSFPEPDARLLTALNSPLVTAWSMRVRVPAMLSSEQDSRAVTLLGVDADNELELGVSAKTLLQGHFLSSDSDSAKDSANDSAKDSANDSATGTAATDTEIVLGARLAGKLETGLGKRIVIMSQDPDNHIVERGFIITGIYHSRTPGLEEQFVYAHRKAVQRLLAIPGRISEIAVMDSQYRDNSKLLKSLQQAIGAELEVQDWQHLDSYLAAMLAMMDGFVLVWILVIFLALSFGLVNTLIMAVFERVREIGLMQALGMRRATVVQIILIESLLLLLLGLLLGNILALLALALIDDGLDVSAVAEGMAMFGVGTVLYPALEMRDLLLADLVVIVLGLMTCLYPAWRASTYDPIVALTKT